MRNIWWFRRRSPLEMRAVATVLTGLLCSGLYAQQAPLAAGPADQSLREELRRVTSAVADAQAQMESTQRQIVELRKEIAQLQSSLAASGGDGATESSTQAVPAQADKAALAAKVDDLRERQEVEQAEIATHEQAKVESGSKYPVKLTGLILLNAFTNTAAVDDIQAPTLATQGSGSTGATFRQTVLGLDAKGPRLFGASTLADVRIDFFGGTAEGSYGPSSGLLRLRTAHASLDWDRTQVLLELDRPILSPNTPTSLTSIAEPALAWSGNLWTWAPQIAVTHSFDVGGRSRVKLQAALIDVPEPPLIGAPATRNTSLAEASRWPGSEARIAFGGRQEQGGAEVGFGGYFSPHRFTDGTGFDAWAGTLDYRIPLPARLEWTGSFYRGLALGGLGGGVYKDYVYRLTPDSYAFRALDDVGGWSQIKARLSDRVQWNAAYGIDNAFARELRPFAGQDGDTYQNLARNHTFFTNVIYSPHASTLFSLEYRSIASSAVTGDRYVTHVLGIAAGYKF